jgi:hypothetical protein
MKRVLLSMTALLVMSLACQQVVVTPTLSPTLTRILATPTAVPSASPAPLTDTVKVVVVRQASVNVRNAANGDPTGEYIYAGQSVTVLEIDGDWVHIAKPDGWVWRGCLSDNPDGLGCEAK